MGEISPPTDPSLHSLPTKTTMASVTESKKRLLDAMASDMTEDESAYLTSKLSAGGATTSFQTGLAFKWIKTDSTVRMLSPEASGTTAAINKFCVDNKLLMVDNPCISPDFCLDWPKLKSKMMKGGMPGVHVYPKSGFATAAGKWKLARDEETGDFGWILTATAPVAGAAAPFSAKKQLISASGTQIFPATWEV